MELVYRMIEGRRTMVGRKVGEHFVPAPLYSTRLTPEGSERGPIVREIEAADEIVPVPSSMPTDGGVGE